MLIVISLYTLSKQQNTNTKVALKHSTQNKTITINMSNKKLSYCWETVRRESIPRIAEMDVEMTI